MAQLNEDDNRPTPFTVSMDAKGIPCNRTGEGPVRLIFTHGAGGTTTSDSIVNFSAGFSKSTRSSVICFQGNMNLKSRVKMFDAVHDNAINTYKHETPIALGGRSMGARAAVLAAMEDTKCLSLASYPLQTDKEIRDQILLDLPAEKDVLFISGDQDSMCDLAKLNEVRGKMKAKTWLIRVRNADHGMNVKPKKATTAVGEECGRQAEEWLYSRKESETECEVWWGEDENGEEGVHSGTWTRTESAARAEKKAKPEAETKTLSSKTKKNVRDEEVLDARKKIKAIPARARKAKGSETTRDAATAPASELRRSKRRKVM